ncbi:DUF3025 domain-containing protein [Rhodoferax koreensis]|nr:DUF3025 domain-containing protein [Rhodoferax koreense]
MSSMAVDWARPWLGAWRTHGESALTEVARGLPVAEALGRMAAAPVRFVPQAALPAGVAYEEYIFRTRTVPTRDNLHDFFNGLCWQRFPATKTRINQLQAAEIRAQGIRPQRGPVRDALTLFDENAAFLIAPPPLWQALAARDWHRLFVGLRPLWAHAQLVLFGHALLEKLAAPRKAITAHVYTGVTPAAADGDDLDRTVAASLAAPTLARKPFLPLPVLGVPGWWTGNEDFSFYDDPFVFRPARVSITNTTNDAA